MATMIKNRVDGSFGVIAGGLLFYLMANVFGYAFIEILENEENPSDIFFGIFKEMFTLAQSGQVPSEYVHVFKSESANTYDRSSSVIQMVLGAYGVQRGLRITGKGINKAFGKFN